MNRFEAEHLERRAEEVAKLEARGRATREDEVQAEAERLTQELAALLLGGNQLGVGRGLLDVLVGDVRFGRGRLVWALLDVLGSLPEVVGKDHKATYAVDACRDMEAALSDRLVGRRVK